MAQPKKNTCPKKVSKKVKLPTITLEEAEPIIYDALVDTHSRYKFMIDVVFPLWRQQSFLNVYPGIARNLLSNAEDAVIMSLSKLLDSTKDPNILHFSRFIKLARGIRPIKIQDHAAWEKFLEKSGKFLRELPAHFARIEPHRNRFRAHLIPKKPVPKAKTTWKQWLKVLEAMEEVFNLYNNAINRAGSAQFWTMNLDHEPESFLKWCCLDDFAKHRELYVAQRRHKLRTEET